MKCERNWTNSTKWVYHIKVLGQPDSHYILLFVQLTDFQLQKEAHIWGLLLSKLNMYILDQFYLIWILTTSAWGSWAWKDCKDVHFISRPSVFVHVQRCINIHIYQSLCSAKVQKITCKIISNENKQATKQHTHYHMSKQANKQGWGKIKAMNEHADFSLIFIWL